jgi:hypothetical protein
LFNTILSNFCDVPIENKDNKDDDLNDMDSKSKPIKDLLKEDKKVEEQKKSKGCCGGGKNKKKEKKKK